MDTEIDDLLRFNTEERKTTAGLWLKKPRHDSHHPDHIRIKLLCGTDDAWRVVRFVQEHLDCW